MAEIRANFLMSYRSITAGTTLKMVDNLVTDTPKAAAAEAITPSTAIQVSLSSAALQITALLQRTEANNSSAADGFERFIQNLHQQLSTQGLDALALRELPEPQTRQRIALSMQASNYLLKSFYGQEKLHANVSSNNPFEGLDRLSLSHIAFDACGAFTPIERKVAFLDLTERDIEFRKQTSGLLQPLSHRDTKVPWIGLSAYLRDAQLASGMSEGERVWRDYKPANVLYAHAQLIMDQHDIDRVDFPAYSNLKGSTDSALGVVAVAEGLSTWINIPVRLLTSQGLYLGLIESAAKQANDKRSVTNTDILQHRNGYSLYSIVGSYQ